MRVGFNIFRHESKRHMRKTIAMFDHKLLTFASRRNKIIRMCSVDVA